MTILDTSVDEQDDMSMGRLMVILRRFTGAGKNSNADDVDTM